MGYKQILLIAATLLSLSGFNSTVAAQSATDTLEKVLSYQIIELNHVWDSNAPVLNINPPFAMAMADTHADTKGMIPDLSYAADLMYFSGQHGAPTIDALGHIAYKNKLHDGVNASENDGSRGLRSKGIEEYPTERLINRAVLLDVARYKSVAHLEPGYEITVEDLQQTASKQGVKLKPGTSVLIRTGFGQFFETDKQKYMGYRPGPGAAAAQWLAEKEIFLAGSDQLTFEVYPQQGTTFPVHKLLLAQKGIYIVENLNLEPLSEALSKSNQYEFLLVLNPPRIRGATGMALNAFALLP